MTSRERSLLTMAAIFLFAPAAWANVGNRAQWAPAFTVEVQAPPPADAAARAKAFEDRNSKDGIEKLAKEFFGLIDMGKVPKPARRQGPGPQVQAGEVQGNPGRRAHGIGAGRNVAIAGQLRYK